MFLLENNILKFETYELPPSPCMAKTFPAPPPLLVINDTKGRINNIDGQNQSCVRCSYNWLNLSSVTYCMKFYVSI